MKKLFLIILIFILFPLATFATSSGNATDKLSYNLNEIIYPDVPTELFYFAYYKPTGEFICYLPAGDTAEYLINTYPDFGNGQNINVIYAYIDDISSNNYYDVIIEYDGREYPMVYYTNAIDMGIETLPTYIYLASIDLATIDILMGIFVLFVIFFIMMIINKIFIKFIRKILNIDDQYY